MHESSEEEAVYIGREDSNDGGVRRLQINLLKFYLPTFCFALISFCINTQSANVFSAKNVLGTNPLKFLLPMFLPYMYDISEEFWHQHLNCAKNH